jgi:hypothetical protein
MYHVYNIVDNLKGWPSGRCGRADLTRGQSIQSLRFGAAEAG